MKTGEIIIYQTPDGKTNLDVKLEQDTVWLSLNQMTTLFDRDKSVISRHIKSIFKRKRVRKEFSCCKKCNNSLVHEDLQSVLVG